MGGGVDDIGGIGGNGGNGGNGGGRGNDAASASASQGTGGGIRELMRVATSAAHARSAGTPASPLTLKEAASATGGTGRGRGQDIDLFFAPFRELAEIDADLALLEEKHAQLVVLSHVQLVRLAALARIRGRPPGPPGPSQQRAARTDTDAAGTAAGRMARDINGGLGRLKQALRDASAARGDRRGHRQLPVDALQALEGAVAAAARAATMLESMLDVACGHAPVRRAAPPPSALRPTTATATAAGQRPGTGKLLAAPVAFRSTVSQHMADARLQDARAVRANTAALATCGATVPVSATSLWYNKVRNDGLDVPSLQDQARGRYRWPKSFTVRPPGKQQFNAR